MLSDSHSNPYPTSCDQKPLEYISDFSTNNPQLNSISLYLIFYNICYYSIFLLLILLFLYICYQNTKYDIYQGIDWTKANALPEEEKNLWLMTKINTRWNRDNLKNSHYYEKIALKELNISKREMNNKTNCNSINDDNDATIIVIDNQDKVQKKRNNYSCLKVSFNDNPIIQEYEDD